MSDVILSLEHVHKKFSTSTRAAQWAGAKEIFRAAIGMPIDPVLQRGEFWALTDICMEMKRGERLALVGANGSGKSTLLRLIGGIYPPDKGTIKSNVRMATLIALGAGFHGHLSGRENIYLNGSILGMSKRDLDSKFDSIVEFSELSAFIDSPVATYSSGMSVRLGYSIAIHSEPELLIVDEVLAVGDLSFVLKCYSKLSDFTKTGGSILFVSHNGQLVRNLAQKAIWLDHGIVRMTGPSNEIMEAYERFAIGSGTAGRLGSVVNRDALVRSDGLTLSSNGAPIQFGDSLKISLSLKLERSLVNPILTFSIESHESILVLNQSIPSDLSKYQFQTGAHKISLDLPEVRLKNGKYFVSAIVAEGDINNNLCWMERVSSFEVLGGRASAGIWDPKTIWSHQKTDHLSQ